MRRGSALLVSLLLGVACALLVAACGSDGGDADLLPQSDASAMVEQLDAIETAVQRGRCTNVETYIADLQSEVNDLSSRVDASLRARLQEGVNNLATIAPDECFAQRATEPTETTPTETTPTETTPTETTPTETTPTETTPTETTPTETIPPETTPTETPTTPVDPGGATAPDSGETGGVEPTP